MMPPSLNFKVWQLAIWDCLCSILSYIPIAFRAYNQAIIGLFTPLCYRYAWDSKPSFSPHNIGIDTFPTPCTNCAEPVSPVLSVLSFEFSPIREPHSKSVSSYIWQKGSIDDYWYHSDNKWTGVLINKRVCLQLLGKIKPMKLNHPVYAITFCPNADTNQIHHLVDVTHLVEAKKLAEWYYKEWLKVNHNLITN